MDVILDFHCHISTPGSSMPSPEGQYYRQLLPATTAGHLLGQLTQDAIDTMAERWRTPGALRTYRNLGPVIYTEMSRRLISTDDSALLAEMVQNGVNQSVVVAMDPFVPTPDILRVCAHLAGVLIPFGSVDPSQPDYLDRFDQLLRAPIAGIKYHSDLQQMPLDDPRLFAMLARLVARERVDLPVYLHTGQFPIYRPLDTPWSRAIPALLEAFPMVTFVCGHAGWDSPRAALRAALRFPNLLLETSWQPSRVIRRLCDKLGPERLLFGSDYPLFSQKRALKNVRAALNDQEFQLVAGENARRLLRLEAGG